MKKIQILSLAALMLLVSNTTMAQQETKSEISFSVGGETPNNKGIGDGIGEAFGSAFGRAIGTILTFGQVDPNSMTDKYKVDDSGSLTFNIQYMYRVAPKVKLGALATYQRTSSKLMMEDTNGNHHEAAKATNDYFVVMPAAKFMWVEKKNIGLYSKVAAGICIASNKAEMTNGVKESTPGELTDRIKSDKGTRFAYQVSAIGLEVGSRNLRGFAELGYGFQGIGQIGICYKF
jgi:hypothetical protein